MCVNGLLEHPDLSLRTPKTVSSLVWTLHPFIKSEAEPKHALRFHHSARDHARPNAQQGVVLPYQGTCELMEETHVDTPRAFHQRDGYDRAATRPMHVNAIPAIQHDNVVLSAVGEAMTYSNNGPNKGLQNTLYLQLMHVTPEVLTGFVQELITGTCSCVHWHALHQLLPRYGFSHVQDTRLIAGSLETKYAMGML